MKIAKLSLVTALLLGSSAYAFENTNVSGDARFFYYTVDGNGVDLFGKDSSYADAGVRLGVTTDITEGVSMGVTGYAVSTLGLEYQVASNAWSGAHYDMVTGEIAYPTTAWIGEAWLSATAGNTTGKVGRMELDTPLAFTEQWGIAPNTFEAALLSNTDIPDTTLVAAWVPQGNGYSGFLLQDTEGQFTPLGDQGAIVLGATNNSYKPLTAQAWYYELPEFASAYWLEADLAMEGVLVGLQYADINPNDALSSADDSTAFAAKLGYEGIENLYVAAAYSTTGKDGEAYVGNVATSNGGLGGSQTKLYTEAWWNFGYVGGPSTDAYNVTAEYSFTDVADFGLYYTNIETKTAMYAAENTLNEVTFTAAKSFGNLDTTFAYIYTDSDDQNGGDAYNDVQFYLVYNFPN